MPKRGGKAESNEGEFAAFQDAMRKMISVPKAKVDAALAEEKAARSKKRKERSRNRRGRRPDETP